MKDGLKLRQRWGQGKLIPNHQPLPQYAKRPVLKVKKKKLFHTLLVSQEPVLIWQEGLQLNQLLLVSGNPGIIFHFSHDLFWTYYGGSYQFSRVGSPSRTSIPLHFWKREIQKTNMAARGYFCASFNTFVRGYFWPVLYKNSGLSNSIYTEKS